MNDGFSIVILILLLGYFMVDFLTGIEDDVVYPATIARAEERCARNDGLKYLEQSGGIASNYHDVVCNDGANFTIPRRLVKDSE